MRALPVTLCGLFIFAAACNVLSTTTPVPGLVSTIVVQTAHAASTATAAAAPPPTSTPSPVASCLDAAELVADTTAAALSNVQPGSRFTRTWMIKNAGQCSWHGYSVGFASGDRMGAADSVPVPDMLPNTTVNVSIDLLAPVSAGSFTGLFELRDSTGEPLSLASGTALAVNIVVLDMTTPAPLAATLVVPPLPADCKYVKSAAYPGDIMNLINNARKGAGLPPLTMNPKLAAAAQGHSADMACNNYLDHAGLNKSTIHDRVVAAGYAPSFSEEMIYCSGYPQDAFDWWMGDPAHHDVIVDARVKEFGVGYAYLPHSQCGSYFTVDLASP